MIKTRKSDYIWNTIGSMIYAFNSVILLMVVVRVVGSEQGGIFSIAYTISQTLGIIGGFEMKVFQVTDRGMYSFQDYLHSRIYTSSAMVIISVGWVLINRFEMEKAILTIVLCLYRLSDSFGDVIEGYYQQTDRLYISGRLLSVRAGIPAIIFIISLLISQNLLISSFFLMFFSILFVLVFGFGRLVFRDNIKLFGGNNNRAMKLLLICLPLFVGSFLSTYITNAPKYAIDRYLSEDIQTYYSIIFMPSFVINLLSGFIFKPLLVEVTSIWEKGESDKILYIIFKMSAWILAITTVGAIGAWVLGIPVLSLIYGLDGLAGYKVQLIIILIGGGINAYNIFQYYMLTIMREQKYILIGYILVFFESIVLSNLLVMRLEIQGAVISYLVCRLSLGLVFMYKIVHNIHNSKKTDNRREQRNG